MYVTRTFIYFTIVIAAECFCSRSVANKMFLLLSLACVFLFYYWLKRHFEQWKRRGIIGPTPWESIVGMVHTLLQRKSVGEVVTEVYRKYEGYPFVGIFAFGTPGLLVRDPDFIRHIVSTDFKCFYNNAADIDRKVDPIVGRNPFFLKGEEWKKRRSELTPGFTSGKMKGAFPLVNRVAADFVKYLEKNCTAVHGKDACTRFTADSVVGSAFGLEGGCFEDDNSDFRQITQGFFGPQGHSTLFATIAFQAPWLFSLYTFKIIPKHVEEKMVNIVSSTMEYRKKNNVSRNDYLQFIMQLKDSDHISNLDATAHAASFLAEGYETSSVVTTFVLYELASNPDTQQKLREEIDEILRKTDGNFHYDSLQEMNYLEACIWESMRLHPVLPVSSKMCNEQFTYTTESENFKKMTVTVKPGTTVFFSMEGLHTDEKYFENPLDYYPERMLNRDDLNKYVLMPFGTGQRKCIGERFAMLQVKLAVAYVVKNFRIKINPKTILPIRPSPWSFMNTLKNPVYFDFEKINS